MGPEPVVPAEGGQAALHQPAGDGDAQGRLRATAGRREEDRGGRSGAHAIKLYRYLFL